MGDIKNQRKKDMKVYEQLEQNLSKFEMEEEQEILKLMQNGSDDTISSGEDEEIRVQDHNIFNLQENGPAMAEQDVESKLREIESKIDNNVYHVEPKDTGDLFFATEVDPTYSKK